MSVLKTLLLDASPTSAKKAAALLRAGEVVALPTETVYGLAGNALSSESVKKIFTAKERPSFDPLIVHISSDFSLQSLVTQKILHASVLTWPSAALLETAMKKFWPGPLTFILPRGEAIPGEVTSGQNTVGLRMPAHPIFQAVLKECGLPLAAPSANRFGRISPTQASHVVEELDGRIAAIVDGGTCAVGVESTIVRVENPLLVTILRPGKITAAELSAVFGVEVSLSVKKVSTPIAPGMLDQHYAPQKKLILLSPGEKLPAPANRSPEIGYLEMLSLSPTGDLKEMAQKLFATLRALDSDPKIKSILADLPNDISSGLGAAIADRLNRASSNKPLF